MLHNIFKKSKSKNKPRPKQVKIIADIHEKDSMIISTLHELKADVEIKSLKVGDYVIGKTLIERKTFRDFIGSMISKRLIQQLRQMKQAKQALLIIEGMSNIDNYTNIHPNSYRGFILSISLNYQIPIIFTEDPEETALYLSLLAKQQAKPHQEISLHSRIPKTKKEQKRYILESFPGIGPKTSAKLIKEFKSLSEVFNAPIETLNKTLKKRGQDFQDLLKQG